MIAVLFRAGEGALYILNVSDFIADYGLVRNLRPEYPAQDRSPCRERTSAKNQQQ
jgi:hypothetical protein